MRKLLMYICLLFVLIVPSTAQNAPVFFAENPTLSPDGDLLVFSYEGDLWQANADGGLASRITAMDGIETRPSISPDGKWLAFNSNQYGNNDIFIMPLSGGDIRQLTYHEAGDVVESWSWDSQVIYFTSGRYNRMSTYKVNLRGGTPVRLFENYFNNIHNAREHPRTGAIYFNETWESSTFAHRKGYKGPYNPDVKSYHPKSKKFQVHTNYEGKDFGVTIDRAGHVYFLSDEANGEYNLYSFEKDQKVQLTKFTSSAQHPFVNAAGGKIVFEKDYQIYAYDVATKKCDRIDLQVARNNTLSKSQNFKVSGNISAFDIADDGKKLAFVSRGELFVSDIKGKFIKQIPTDALGRVMEVNWLKDNKTLIFNQTVGGYLNWFSIGADGNTLAKQLTNDNQNNRLLNFNSDKTKAVYLSGREEVRLMELDSFKSELLLKEELWGFYNNEPSFSPDDRYVLFSAYRNFETDIFLYDLKERKSINISKTGVTETTPVWSPDGKYIYFTSNRTKPSYPYGLRESNIYRMALEKIDEPFRSDKFEKLFEEKPEKEKEPNEKEKADEEKKKEKVVVNIDFTDLMKRLERVGPSFGRQAGSYVTKKDGKTTVLFISNHDEGKANIWKAEYEDFEKTKTKKIEGAETSGLNIKSAKEKYYALIKGNIHQLKLDGNKTEEIKIDHRFQRKLQAEFEQMYYETWANLEENFYNENFHGVNWPVMRDRYAGYLPHIHSRANLRNLLNDMLGELNTSHFGFYSNGKEERLYYGTKSIATGLLFDEADAFKVSSIVKNSPVDRQGKNIKPGDRLVSLNGEKLNPKMNREYYFARPAVDEEIELGLERDGDPYTVKIHPTSYRTIVTGLYDEWIEQRQQIVDQKTQKRVAYVHMKNMGGGSLDQFKLEMVSEAQEREALILDLRYNTGGNVHDEVLQFLSQKPYLQWKYREGALTPQPNFGPAAKPIVLLINEQSLSDAEMTASGFKQLGLGKLIGTGTYRWIIFTSGKSLVDGSSYRLPSWGCYTLDGENLEKTGVEPNIYVKNTFTDRLTGKDPQLDRAIEEVLTSLKKEADVRTGN